MKEIISIFLKPLEEFISSLFLNTRKDKRINNLLKQESLFKYLDTKDVEKDAQEAYFYSKTGINVDYENIDAYKSLKEQVGAEVSWRDLRKVKIYTSFNDGEINIKMSRLSKMGLEVVRYLSLFLMLSFLFPLFYIFYPSNSGNLSEQDRRILGATFLAALYGAFLVLYFVNKKDVVKRINKKMKFIKLIVNQIFI